ncbi:PAS domain S-box protein [Burkholderiaceae bacterium DAT-1]|nr:PAS domain S-box protein [Burkholderiaceae bacterium DAT-1]
MSLRIKRALQSRNHQTSKGKCRTLRTRADVSMSDHILNRLPLMVGYWDASLRNRYGNDAYQSWFGASAKQMYGKPIEHILGEHYYARVKDNVRQALAGKPQRLESTLTDSAGNIQAYFLVQYLPCPAPNGSRGFIAVGMDITDYKQKDALIQQKTEELISSEARYRAVVQDQTEVISRLTGDGRYLFTNEVFCRFFGKTSEEMRGSNWHPLVYSEDFERVKTEISQLSPSNPVVMIENRVYSGEGKLYWMQFSNRGTFDEAGNLLEIQSVGRDISERKRAEVALNEANADLRASLAQLRKLSIDATMAEARERRAIADDLHDDIGQALHIIRLKLDQLRQDCRPDQLPHIQALQTIADDTSRNIRTLTAELHPPVLKQLGLIATLKWIVPEMARVYGLTVHLSCDEHKPPLSDVQAILVYRTVRELLINIVRHAGVNDAYIDARCAQDRLHLRITDHGRGMQEETPSAKQTHHHGLASVRERIEYMGGQLVIRSHPGSGTSVWIEMPLETIAQADGSTA